MEFEALLKLRKGFLYLIVAAIMVFAGFLAGLTSLFFAVAPFGEAPKPPLALSSVAVAVAALLVGLALSLYAVFSKIRGGFRELSQVDRSFGICYTGTTLMLVGLVLWIVGALLFIAFLATALPTLPPGGRHHGGVFAMFILPLTVIVLGLIFAVLGSVLAYVVGAFKLNDRYKDSLFLAAGILYIIDLVLTFVGLPAVLQFVGHILMYVALGRAAEGVKTQATNV